MCVTHAHLTRIAVHYCWKVKHMQCFPSADKSIPRQSSHSLVLYTYLDVSNLGCFRLPYHSLQP